ncbi:MAG: hypothetical protein IPK80_11790 [Nannocystis sp.]|nr:hypothetical protein [Nannocystis sp.]
MLLRNHLADVAHDLRSPLTSMQLTLERLVDPARPMEREAAHADLEDVAYMSQRIANLSLASQLAEGADPLQDGVTRPDRARHRAGLHVRGSRG